MIKARLGKFFGRLCTQGRIREGVPTSPKYLKAACPAVLESLHQPQLLFATAALLDECNETGICRTIDKNRLTKINLGFVHVERSGSPVVKNAKPNGKPDWRHVLQLHRQGNQLYGWERANSSSTWDLFQPEVSLRLGHHAGDGLVQHNQSQSWIRTGRIRMMKATWRILWTLRAQRGIRRYRSWPRRHADVT